MSDKENKVVRHTNYLGIPIPSVDIGTHYFHHYHLSMVLIHHFSSEITRFIKRSDS